MNTEDCQKPVTRDYLDSKLQLLKSELNLERSERITEALKILSIIIATASVTTAIVVSILR